MFYWRNGPPEAHHATILEVSLSHVIFRSFFVMLFMLRSVSWNMIFSVWCWIGIVFISGDCPDIRAQFTEKNCSFTLFSFFVVYAQKQVCV